MHRSKRHELDLDHEMRVHPAATPASGATSTLLDLQRVAAQALDVWPRIIAAGEQVDLPVADEPAGPSAASSASRSDASAAYRLRAMGPGDAIVIQHLGQADASPFSGLLVTRAPVGQPPRLLFDMGPLTDGSRQLAEARRMLDAVVRRASLS